MHIAVVHMCQFRPRSSFKVYIRAGVAGTARPVLHFLEIGCACACAYNEVGVAPTCCGSSACVCGQSYGQLCLPRCLESGNPLAQKRGGAKHIRKVVYTEPDRFSKVAPMPILKRSGSRDSRHG